MHLIEAAEIQSFETSFHACDEAVRATLFLVTSSCIVFCMGFYSVFLHVASLQ